MKGFPFLVGKVVDMCNELVCACSIISQSAENKHRDRAGNRKCTYLEVKSKCLGKSILHARIFW